jgi:hypothetical protein
MWSGRKVAMFGATFCPALLEDVRIQPARYRKGKLAARLQNSECRPI